MDRRLPTADAPAQHADAAPLALTRRSFLVVLSGFLVACGIGTRVAARTGGIAPPAAAFFTDGTGFVARTTPP